MNWDERLTQLVAEILKIPAAALTDEFAMHECGTWDSLSHIEIIAAVEDEFRIELTTEEIIAMTTIGAIRSVVLVKAAAAWK